MVKNPEVRFQSANGIMSALAVLIFDNWLASRKAAENSNKESQWRLMLHLILPDQIKISVALLS
jgi:hypothetical protein